MHNLNFLLLKSFRTKKITHIHNLKKQQTPCINFKNRIKRGKKKATLITTEVTLLSTQKKVSDLLAYCSENFLIISTDFSDGSTKNSITKNTNKNLNIKFPIKNQNF